MGLALLSYLELQCYMLAFDRKAVEKQARYECVCVCGEWFLCPCLFGVTLKQSLTLYCTIHFL